MMRTIEFVYYLFWVGVLIAALRLAEVSPWTYRFALIFWPILIGESVWFFASYLPRRRKAGSLAEISLPLAAPAPLAAKPLREKADDDTGTAGIGT